MIEVGEYVRTPEEGYIGKLVEHIENALNYYKIDVGREIIHCDNLRDNYIYSREGFGLKHSKELIDLIKVGDYVNGEIIDQIQNDRNPKLIWHLSSYGDDDMAFKNEDIETVVTKEMMESISYKVTKM